MSLISLLLRSQGAPSTTPTPGTCVEGLYVSYFTVAKEPVGTLQQHTLQVHVLRGYMSLISLLLRSQCVHFNNTRSRYMC